MRFHVRDSGDCLQCSLCLRHQRDVRQLNDEAMPEDRCVNALHECSVIITHKIIHCCFSGDELGGADIVRLGNCLLQGSRFAVAERLVHKGNNFILIFKISDQ